jgi:hypothetical protein
MQENTDSDYRTAFRGSFTSALRWHHLDALWERLREDPENWYVYSIGHEPPRQVASREEFLHFLEEIDKLLRAENEEDYCGIVYADDLQKPAMVKIYDPNNLGVVCGYSDNPPLPGWVLSRIPPVDMEAGRLLPNNRKRWWRRLFG